MVGDRSRTPHVVHALVAWFGAILALISAAWGYNLPAGSLSQGVIPGGVAGALERMWGTMTYFTWLSNAVVAVSATMVALRPERNSWVGRSLRLTGLLMITVTFIIYHAVLAANDTSVGLDRFAGTWQHVVTPVVTVLIWLAYGPRGWISLRTVFASLALPILWVVFTFVRGEFTGTYPYDCPIDRRAAALVTLRSERSASSATSRLRSTRRRSMRSR